MYYYILYHILLLQHLSNIIELNYLFIKNVVME